MTPYSTAGRVMANLVLKPQVAAFLDVVTTAQGDDFLLEEIEVTRTCARGRADDSRPARARRDRRDHRRAAQGRRDVRHDSVARRDDRVGDVLIGVGTPQEIRMLETFFAPREAVAR